MLLRGTALPCNRRPSFGAVGRCFWSYLQAHLASSCVYACLFWAGGRTRDNLQPGLIKLQNVQITADLICNAVKLSRHTGHRHGAKCSAAGDMGQAGLDMRSKNQSINRDRSRITPRSRGTPSSRGRWRVRWGRHQCILL